MIGRNLGRYRLLAEAPGGGGLFRARDTLVEREVDLQLVPAAVTADPERLGRLRGEVERAAGFVHPDVATLYGLESAEASWFVTMEPAAAERTLAQALDGGRLGLEAALEVGVALAGVLASAEEAGVVHGGLRPADVILGAAGTITVRGFGLHELRRAAAEEGAAAAADAAYRPPESTAGVAPDRRDDIFALGRLLERMVAAAPGEEGRPAAASRALGELIERCLSDDPAGRPGSAAEVRRALEEIQVELGREPEPEPEPEAARPAWGVAAVLRRPAIAAVVVLLVLVAGWLLWRGRGSEPSQDESTGADAAAPAAGPVDLAVMPFANLGDDEDRFLAAGLQWELTRRLALAGLSLISPGSAEAAAGAGAGDRLGAAHRLEGSFHWQRDGELNALELVLRLVRTADGEVVWGESYSGFLKEILALQGQVAAAVGRLLGAAGEPDRRPPTRSLEAYAAYLEGVGRMAAAVGREQLRAAAASLELAAILDPGLLPAHARLARLRVALHAAEPGAGHLEAAREALAAARRIDGEDPEVHRAAGELELAADGDTERAYAELTAALAKLPGDSDLLRDVARIDRQRGRWPEAAEGLAAAVRHDPLAPGLLVELVETLLWQRRFAEAASQVERARRTLPEAPEPALLRAELLLAERGATRPARAILQGMPESARSDERWRELMLRIALYEGAWEEALERLATMVGDETEKLIARAWIHRHMGDERSAAVDFDRARKRLEDRLAEAPGNPRLATSMGQAYAGSGGGRLGIRMGQRAVALLPVTDDAVRGVIQVERLARIYVLAGDPEGAIDELGFLLQIPSPVTTALLGIDPAWEPLRAEPAFRELRQRFAPGSSVTE